MDENKIKKIATDAATNVYNRLSTQTGIAKMGVHKHNGHDTTQIDYNDLTNQLTATAPLVITQGTASVISIPGAAFVPTGSILMYGTYSSVPTGYLLCDGNSYSQTTYAALFAVIGTSFGSVDGSHFNVPYMSGRVPVGATSNAGQGGGTSGSQTRPTGGSTLTQYKVGDWEGEETHVLTVGELASHTHRILNTSGSPSGTLATPDTNGSTTIDNGITTDSTGSNTAHNTIQPVMGLAFIIKT